MFLYNFLFLSIGGICELFLMEYDKGNEILFFWLFYIIEDFVLINWRERVFFIGFEGVNVVT